MTIKGIIAKHTIPQYVEQCLTHLQYCCKLWSAGWREIFNLRQVCMLIYVYLRVLLPCK